MKHRMVTALLVVTAVVVATLASTTTTNLPAQAAAGGSWDIDTWGGPPHEGDSVVLRWNEQLLDVIRNNPGLAGPTVSARMLGVLNTAMYDAWAAYDPVAIGTRLGGSLRRPEAEFTTPNKSKAISYAAYETLLYLFPGRKSAYDAQWKSLYGVDFALDDTPSSMVGDQAAQAVIAYRRGDGSNQTGGYADTTGYMNTVKNTWNSVPQEGMWHWQPLCVLTAAGVTANQPPVRDPSLPCPDTTPPTNYTVQKPLTPQWKNVFPFGPLNSTTHYPNLFQLQGPPKLANGEYDPADVGQALSDTSTLSDAAKVKAEYWADGPGSVFPPGHMVLFAQALSRMRQNSLDQDVKLFFILGNALMDSSISAWAAKYQYDFWRPTTAIRVLYKDKLVVSWLGPGKGYGKVLGKNWMPYQQLNVVTPAFPEYVSGHSTFSASGRTVLTMFYGNNDAFDAKVTIKAGSSAIERGTPAKDMVLSWKTLTAAADEAGMSRRYGGIHFYSGDQQGRALGRLIGYDDFNWAQNYFKGVDPTATS